MYIYIYILYYIYTVYIIYIYNVQTDIVIIRNPMLITSSQHTRFHHENPLNPKPKFRLWKYVEFSFTGLSWRC